MTTNPQLTEDHTKPCDGDLASDADCPMGARFGTMRNELRLTQREVLDAIGMGDKGVRYLSEWERGCRIKVDVAFLESLSRFADRHGFSVGWLILGEGPSLKEVQGRTFDCEHAAAMVGAEPWTLRVLAKGNLIPYHMIGDQVHFSVRDVWHAKRLLRTLAETGIPGTSNRERADALARGCLRDWYKGLLEKADTMQRMFLWLDRDHRSAESQDALEGIGELKEEIDSLKADFQRFEEAAADVPNDGGEG